MNLLHIDASILGGNSVSRVVAAAVVDRLAAAPGTRVVARDLAAAPIPHLSGAYLAGASADVQHDQALQEDLDLGGAVLAEFLAADVVVIGVPMYNFTIPSQLKAWIDRILVAGKTFRYTETGPQGLAGGKRVVLALARGGHYGPGTPAHGLEHAETYLRGVFGFIGIPAVEVIAADGLALGPDPRAASLAAAKETAAHLPAT